MILGALLLVVPEAKANLMTFTGHVTGCYGTMPVCPDGTGITFVVPGTNGMLPSPKSIDDEWAVYAPAISVHIGATLFGNFAGPEASFFIFDHESTGLQLSGSSGSRAFSLALYRPADGINDLSPRAGVPASLSPSGFPSRSFWLELYESPPGGPLAIGGVRGTIDGYAGPDRLPDGSATAALLVLGLAAVMSLPRRRG